MEKDSDGELYEQPYGTTEANARWLLMSEHFCKEHTCRRWIQHRWTFWQSFEDELPVTWSLPKFANLALKQSAFKHDVIGPY